jgi:hypothetical protein
MDDRKYFDTDVHVLLNDKVARAHPGPLTKPPGSVSTIMHGKIADLMAVIVGHIQLARLQLAQGESIEERLRGIETVATDVYNLAMDEQQAIEDRPEK